MWSGAMRFMLQVIVKFKPYTIPAMPHRLRTCLQSRVCRSSMCAPLSGAACVITQRTEDVTGFSHEQETLKCHPAIEWLDEDRMIKSW
jgi:hypothetical protein